MLRRTSQTAGWKPAARAACFVAAFIKDSLRVFEFFSGARGLGSLGVQGFTVAEAALEKLRPGGNGDDGIDFIRKQVPKIRMVPAKVLAGAVAVLANAGAEFFDFGQQFLAGHGFEVFVHVERVGRVWVWSNGRGTLFLVAVAVEVKFAVLFQITITDG